MRHWATAGTVLIEGATGPNSQLVNGDFEVAERPDNEPPIYRRVDGRDWWLFVNKDDNWAVSHKEDKDARKTSSTCTAYSVEAADGRLPHEVGAAWKVYTGTELVRQQLRVLHGHEAEVAIAEVCVCVKTHECTQAHTNMHACTHAHMRARPHTLTHLHTCTHAHMHTCTRTHSHAVTHHACRQACTHAILCLPHSPPAHQPAKLQPAELSRPLSSMTYSPTPIARQT